MKQNHGGEDAIRCGKVVMILNRRQANGQLLLDLSQPIGDIQSAIEALFGISCRANGEDACQQMLGVLLKSDNTANRGYSSASRRSAISWKREIY